MQLTLRWLPETFTLCRLPVDTPIVDVVRVPGVFSLTRTADELSLVLQEDAFPVATEGWRVEPGWSAFVVEGPLDFDLTGVLASLAAPLAAARIPIFALSTFNTDYILVKTERSAAAQTTLEGAGHTFARS